MIDNTVTIKLEEVSLEISADAAYADKPHAPAATNGLIIQPNREGLTFECLNSIIMFIMQI